MRVLIAPDCFGDSLTATEAARAVAAGWHAARPHDVLVPAPQSDGGPGFVEVLSAGRPGMQRRRLRVSGPLPARGRSAEWGAEWGAEWDAEWIYDRDSRTAYIESAQACGLARLGGPPTPRTALDAHSRGVGQLIEAALATGAHTVVVGLGGSACTDGGRGMIGALGGTRAALDRLAGVDLVAATDVEHPLLGPSGSAFVFGPQKGADPATVELLERRMLAWADELEAATGRRVRTLPGAGAAGGLGAALLALGGRRASGALLVAGLTGLTGAIADADLIVTGEGRLDEQSLRGKVVGAIAGLARAERPGGVPVLVLAGQVQLPAEALASAGLTAAHSLADHAGSVRRAIDDAAAQLAGLAERTAAGLLRE